jgi:hypothetical protein
MKPFCFLSGAVRQHNSACTSSIAGTNTEFFRWLMETMRGNRGRRRIAMEWLAYGIPTLILLAALIYGVMRAGWLTPRERRQLDANTEAAQRRDDPQKRGGSA